MSRVAISECWYVRGVSVSVWLWGTLCVGMWLLKGRGRLIGSKDGVGDPGEF
jgi:hypothetical protein